MLAPIGCLGEETSVASQRIVLQPDSRGCGRNERLLSLRCGPLFRSRYRLRPLWWPYGTRSWTGTLSTTCSVSPSRSGCDRTSTARLAGSLSSESFDARLAHSRRFVGPLSCACASCARCHRRRASSRVIGRVSAATPMLSDSIRARALIVVSLPTRKKKVDVSGVCQRSTVRP